MTVFENTVSVTQSGSDRQIMIEGFGYDDKRDFFIVFLKEPLNEGGNISIAIDFLGNLNDQLSGFYRSSFSDPVRPIQASDLSTLKLLR